MTEKYQKKGPQPTNVLYLSNVPTSHNTVIKLFDHFKAYGHIQSIWASGTNATIAYESVESCIKAFNSPEAFANNRFVHYHYHVHPQTAESTLSLCSNMEDIEKEAQEVIKKIENESAETLKLQSSIFDSQEQRQKDDVQAIYEETRNLITKCQKELSKAKTEEDRQLYQSKLDRAQDVLKSLHEAGYGDI